MSELLFSEPIAHIHTLVHHITNVCLCLDEPLLASGNHSAVRRNILTLLTELSILNVKATSQPLPAVSSFAHPSTSSPQHNQEVANSRLKEVEEILANQDYKDIHADIETRDMLGFFPDVASSLGYHPQTTSSPFVTVDEYFQQMSLLHQLSSLCTQLRDDVQNLNNHKYIAHQVALLYQSVNACGSASPALLPFKKEIESQFDSIKGSTEKDKTPRLSAFHVSWLLKLTAGIMAQVETLSPDLFRKIQPFIEFVHKDR
eukprot:TRINITY_DN2483_c1_g1_i1.p1 TRINITY_DN2483_c1_g1~~TRINITY_DN2483_c1_g1_i1.p1  ORF type:complete len:259 (-),score=55.19 TRINITY_DN2483_c1_g1_i1:83-859(-)